MLPPSRPGLRFSLNHLLSLRPLPSTGSSTELRSRLISPRRRLTGLLATTSMLAKILLMPSLSLLDLSKTQWLPTTSSSLRSSSSVVSLKALSLTATSLRSQLASLMLSQLSTRLRNSSVPSRRRAGLELVSKLRNLQTLSLLLSLCAKAWVTKSRLSRAGSLSLPAHPLWLRP